MFMCTGSMQISGVSCCGFSLPCLGGVRVRMMLTNATWSSLQTHGRCHLEGEKGDRVRAAYMDWVRQQSSCWVQRDLLIVYCRC